jgi:hypothetical protein
MFTLLLLQTQLDRIKFKWPCSFNDKRFETSGSDCLSHRKEKKINFVQTKQKNTCWAEEKTGGIKQIQCVIDHLFFF